MPFRSVRNRTTLASHVDTNKEIRTDEYLTKWPLFGASGFEEGEWKDVNIRVGQYFFVNLKIRHAEPRK